MRTADRTGLRLVGAAMALVLVGGVGAACQEDRDVDVPEETQEDRADERASDGEPHAGGTDRAENVIFIVGDGMGIAQRELIRLTTTGRDGDLAMNQLEYQGWTQTDPADPELTVTDSASAATALASGVRSYVGAIAVDPDGNPVTTLLERAEQAGKVTGVVTTSRVTDATPAAFAAHAADRDEQSEVARQYLEETELEVILGGGGERWISAGTDLVQRAQQLGYQHVTDADGLAAVDDGKVLGLFAGEQMFEREDGDEATYDPAVPLPVMAAKALDILSQGPDGFFLLIEEEGIDAMSHDGNGALVIEAGRALDETVAIARDFADEHGNTLVVVVGDHETGGLAIKGIEPDEATDERKPDEEGPFTVAGTDLVFDIEWTTGGHTGTATPVSAEGPGANAMVDVRHHTDIHDLVLAAMRLD